MPPEAKAGVADLLGGDPFTAMAAVSDWADRIRWDRHQTAPWHYVDIPIGSQGYSPARDCPDGDCVVAQITREEAVVADKHLLRPVRAEALKFLIHFVGDIHQPLHAANNNDRGGNECG